MLYEFMCLWNEPIKARIVSTQTCLATYVQVCICSGWQVNSSPKVIAFSLGFLSSPWQLPLYNTKPNYKARLVSQRGILSRNPAFQHHKGVFQLSWQDHNVIYIFLFSSDTIMSLNAWDVKVNISQFIYFWDIQNL